MDGLESTQQLVGKVLCMVVAKRLVAQNTVQVRVHELLYQVRVAERGRIAWHHGVDQLDNVLACTLLGKVAQQAHFAERTDRQEWVLKRSDALHGDVRPGVPVHGREHHAIAALANDPVDAVLMTELVARLAQRMRTPIVLASLCGVGDPPHIGHGRLGMRRTPGVLGSDLGRVLGGAGNVGGRHGALGTEAARGISQPLFK